MNELSVTAMDRAQPTWTRLYYAPLVFSRNKNVPVKWWWSSSMEASYIITDTQVSISLLHDGETEPRTAAAHPLEFEDRRHPFTRDEHQSICHHLCEPEGLWDDLCEDFLTMCREGTLTLVARPYYPLEKFSVIAPDAFEHFTIENSRTGVAKAPGGERMYSMHAYRPVDAQGPLPMAPERTRAQVARAKVLIARLYPNGTAGIESSVLEEAVQSAHNAEYASAPKGTLRQAAPSYDSIMRADYRADDRRGRSKRN
jgi:hypothetical protein